MAATEEERAVLRVTTSSGMGLHHRFAGDASQVNLGSLIMLIRRGGGVAGPFGLPQFCTPEFHQLVDVRLGGLACIDRVADLAHERRELRAARAAFLLHLAPNRCILHQHVEVRTLPRSVRDGTAQRCKGCFLADFRLLFRVALMCQLVTSSRLCHVTIVRIGGWGGCWSFAGFGGNDEDYSDLVSVQR